MNRIVGNYKKQVENTDLEIVTLFETGKAQEEEEEEKEEEDVCITGMFN